jgi:hypothetical protein
MQTIPDSVPERFLYRRQFVLGPAPAPGFGHWPTVSVGGRLTLHAHPDLTLTQVTRGRFELTALGDLVDGLHPERGNVEVLQAIASQATASVDVTRLTAGCGGRWVLIAWDGRSTILVHDACGLRMVNYCSDRTRGPWCASQPGRIAEVLGLERDPIAQAEFVESDYVVSHAEYQWPGTGTPYASVRRLLPNFYLDLDTQQAHRYWPREPIPQLSEADAVLRAGSLMRGLVTGAGRRFPLALPMTAGVDCRTILAASREIAPQLYCYTLRFARHDERYPDFVVPSRLLPKLGLRHHLILCPPAMTGAFADMYRRNVASPHETAGAIAQGLLAAYPGDHVCLTSHMSEVARCYYVKLLRRVPEHVTADMLLEVEHMQNSPFARRHVEEWLLDALRVEKQTGFSVLDLYLWEQAWGGEGEAEWDIVQERFPVFSCRELLVTLLGAPMASRRQPGNALYTALMRHLWPEVLSEPFNPRRETWKDAFRPLLKATGTEGLVRRFYRSLRAPEDVGK